MSLRHLLLIVAVAIAAIAWLDLTAVAVLIITGLSEYWSHSHHHA
jgi:hypothetical protein